MATTVDAKAIASAFYETLLGTAIEQLRAAAPKLIDVSAADAAQRIDAALPKNAMPQVRNFLMGLAREGLLDRVTDVIEALEAYLAGPPTAKLEAVVTSAVELTDAQRKRIVTELQQRYGGELTVNFTVDSSLIGGLIIRVGDEVLDNSLRTRLSAIQRSMLNS